MTSSTHLPLVQTGHESRRRQNRRHLESYRCWPFPESKEVDGSQIRLLHCRNKGDILPSPALSALRMNKRSQFPKELVRQEMGSVSMVIYLWPMVLCSHASLHTHPLLPAAANGAFGVSCVWPTNSVWPTAANNTRQKQENSATMKMIQ